MLIILCPCGGTGIRTRLRTGVLGVQISPRILLADSSNRKGRKAFNLAIWVRAPYPSPVGRRSMVGHQIVALRIRVRFPSITPWANMHSGDCSRL